jgi:hypothetical protein
MCLPKAQETTNGVDSVWLFDSFIACHVVTESAARMPCRSLVVGICGRPQLSGIEFVLRACNSCLDVCSFGILVQQSRSASKVEAMCMVSVAPIGGRRTESVEVIEDCAWPRPCEGVIRLHRVDERGEI